jgi:hypothetical protein
MTRTSEHPDRPSPLSLSELFNRYLAEQITAQEQGLGYPEPGEAVPYEAVPIQPVDPQLAWNDALVAVKLLHPEIPARTWTVPPDWPPLVASQESAVALAFCVGNFPQLVRNLHPLLSDNPAALRTLPPQAPSASAGTATALVEWASRMRDYPQVLLAAGVLRLARHFDEAEALLRVDPSGHGTGGLTPRRSPDWSSARANEQAALAWHRGQGDRALQMWQAQADSVPVLFNRGMAALFLGHSPEAHRALTQAVAGLPETSAWYHLGQLYLALAEARTV